MDKVRLDSYLAREGYAETRTKALYEIREGRVTVNGRTVLKPSRNIFPGDQVEVHGKSMAYVGRAALKLNGFLETSQIPIQGKKCCDVGSSTGGFTQLLLEHGAESVDAVDVGTGQMHELLRDDPRISLFEQTDFRDYFKEERGLYDILTADLSFISLRKLVPLVREKSNIFIFKPQFETERSAKNKKGVVTDLDIHVQILESFMGYLLKERVIPFIIRRSVIAGGSGNREYFIACSGEKRDGDIQIEKEVYSSEDTAHDK